MLYRKLTPLLLPLLLMFTQQVFAQQTIIFSTAPTHNRDDTIKLYTPLMNYLSQVTGQRFELDPANNFIEYSTRMRLDKYDMLFDGPHLAGWRMDMRDHQPLARLPGAIRIVLIGRDDSQIQSMAELEQGTTRVCAFASPNMLTLAFLSYYPNPVRQPVLLRTQGFAELEKCLRSGRGEAAVVRDGQWKNMNQEGLKLIASPQAAYPERTFTISSRIDPALREQIREALLSEEGKQAMVDVLARFNRKNLIPAQSSDYTGLGALLLPVWGFH